MNCWPIFSSSCARPFWNQGHSGEARRPHQVRGTPAGIPGELCRNPLRPMLGFWQYWPHQNTRTLPFMVSISLFVFWLNGLPFALVLSACLLCWGLSLSFTCSWVPHRRFTLRQNGYGECKWTVCQKEPNYIVPITPLYELNQVSHNFMID